MAAGVKTMEECYFVQAPKNEANRILTHLLKNDLVRKDLKIRNEADKVLIPVKEVFPLKHYRTSLGRFMERELPVSPVEQISIKMQTSGSDERIPDKFIRLGDALVFKESRLLNWSEELLEATAQQFSVHSIYLDSGIGNSVRREPVMKLIYGPGGDIIHQEGEVRYSFDPSKVMFSPGNVNIRLSKRYENLDGKTVLDMFAGIGYFSLHAGTRSRKATIYASEINPVSFKYLEKNILLNSLEKTVKPLQGDCRTISREIVADYIIMGHFDCMDYLSSALIHSRRGTVIDLHLLLDTGNINSGYLSVIQKASAFGYTLDLLDQEIVKSYGPHLWHISVKFIISDTKL